MHLILDSDSYLSTDVDPEELENAVFGRGDDADTSSGNDREQSELNGRAHYVHVGYGFLYVYFVHMAI